MISDDLRAKIRRLFFAEHWRIGTIATELGVHRDTKVAELHDEEMKLFRPLAQEVLGGLLRRFEHGTPPAQLNRHAVMHGGDARYGTRENAIAAIVWADYIMYLAHDFKAIAIPKNAAEAAEIMKR